LHLGGVPWARIGEAMGESGATVAAGTLGALGAKDAYGKVKGAFQPKDEGSQIVLPLGTHTDE
jgi:hypothetical protein